MDYIVASRPGGVEILLAASCYKSSGSYEPVWLQGSHNVNHVDAHFKVFSKCIATKSSQGFSLR